MPCRDTRQFPQHRLIGRVDVLRRRSVGQEHVGSHPPHHGAAVHPGCLDEALQQRRFRRGRLLREAGLDVLSDLDEQGGHERIEVRGQAAEVEDSLDRAPPDRIANRHPQRTRTGTAAPRSAAPPR